MSMLLQKRFPNNHWNYPTDNGSQRDKENMYISLSYFVISVYIPICFTNNTYYINGYVNKLFRSASWNLRCAVWRFSIKLFWTCEFDWNREPLCDRHNTSWHSLWDDVMTVAGISYFKYWYLQTLSVWSVFYMIQTHILLVWCSFHRILFAFSLFWPLPSLIQLRIWIALPPKVCTQCPIGIGPAWHVTGVLKEAAKMRCTKNWWI